MDMNTIIQALRRRLVATEVWIRNIPKMSSRLFELAKPFCVRALNISAVFFAACILTVGSYQSIGFLISSSEVEVEDSTVQELASVSSNYKRETTEVEKATTEAMFSSHRRYLRQDAISDEAFYALATKVGWPEEELKNVYIRAMCESSLVPTAKNENYNGSTDRGLLQINTIHREKFGIPDMNILYDPETNLHFGHLLWSEQGWKPWRASNGCARKSKWKKLTFPANIQASTMS